MADPIRGFFETQIGPDATPVYTDREAEERRRLQIASCALLLELAHADEEFSDAERRHIEDVTRRHFGLDEDGARGLVALSEAERKQGTELHVFADLIHERFDPDQKTRLLEILWALAMSDGDIAQHESYLMGRLADLLHVSPDVLAQARRRAEASPPG